MKKRLMTVFIALVFLTGLGITLYPVVSNYINEKNQSKIVAAYSEKSAGMEAGESAEIFKAADAYNQELREAGKAAFFKPSLVSHYDETLDISGTGIMGYIEIPRLKLTLPVYHGTEPGVLQVAAGHLEGSSLPVGGRGTHAVVSAHRGLPSAKLFTDLDQMEVGDTFTFTVLDRHLRYKVDQIITVLPDETESLMIDPSEDYFSLMTCTPYGINTHRLIIRGSRTEDEAAAVPPVHIQADKPETTPRKLSAAVPAAAAAVLAVLLLIAAHYRRKRIKRSRKTEVKECARNAQFIK